MRFPAPGDNFEGRYLIEAILGSGGFARVYKARETGLDREVALKVLRPPDVDGQDDHEREQYRQTLMQRFEREARLLSKLRCPHTITMHHYGRTSNGLLYMALEYIDGLSLAELMRQGQPVRVARVAKILMQVLTSLHEAHSLGMLHRDLKPANIMIFEQLGDPDQVKLLDFGIAKTLSDDTKIKRDLTSDGTLIGTPRYMAPEQIQGRSDIGPPSDLYALGLVAYELLAGRRAIEGDSSIQIIGAQLAPESFRLPEDQPFPPKLRAIINRMMAKDITQRYATAADVIADLRAPDLLSNASTEEVEHLPEIESLEFETMEPRSNKSRNVLLAGIAIVAGIAFAGGLVIYFQQTAPPVTVDTSFSFSVDSNAPETVISVDGKKIGKVPAVVTTKTLPIVVTAVFGTKRQTREVAKAEAVRFEFEVEEVDPLADAIAQIDAGNLDEALKLCQEADSIECIGRVGAGYVEAGKTDKGCELLSRAGQKDERCSAPAKVVPTAPPKVRTERPKTTDEKPKSTYTKIIIE